jgi:AraC family transcriptional regulator
MLQVHHHTYAPGLKQARHAHADTTVTLVLRGSLHERVGGVTEIARPLSIVVKPSDTEHTDEFGAAGAYTLQIRIPAHVVEPMVEWQPSLGQWRWEHAPRAASSFLALLEQFRSTPSDTTALQPYIIDALAALAPEADHDFAPPKWLLMVREAIDDAAHPPRLSDLAILAGVHPVYLARLFRRAFGCSVNEYIQSRRIQKVAELTTDGRHSLSTAAHAAGFSDHAHMCRVFRSRLQTAPGAVRRSLMQQV